MSRHSPTELVVAGTSKLAPRDLLTVFFRRRWIVLGIFLPIIAFGVIGTLTASEDFLASAHVLIEGRAITEPSYTRVSVNYDVLMSTASLVSQSIPVAERAAKALADSMTRLQVEDPLLHSIRSERDLRDLILSNTSSGQVGESNILAINFTHRNADLALLVVEAVTNAYIDYNIESQQNTAAVDYYTDQIALLQKEAEALMAQRVEIFSEAGVNAFQTNNVTAIQQMRGLEYSYYQTRSRRQGLEDSYRTLVEAIKVNPDYTPASVKTEKHSLTRAKSALDQAMLDLARLRLTYNDSSTFVQRQMEYVADARRLFESERDGILADLESELNSATAQENSLLEALDQYRREIEAYPMIEQRVATIDMRLESQRNLLKALQLMRGEVRLKAETDQRISNITPLNEPTVTLAVGGGRKIIYLVLTMALGLILSLIVALLIDAQDHRIFDRRQAESALEIPVLGAISSVSLPSGKR